MYKLILILMICFASSSVQADLRNGLVGWWKLDEVSGDVIDSTEQANTGTPVGTTIVSDCKRSGCRQFNGTSDGVRMGETAALTLGKVDFSASVWVKFTSTDFSTFLAWRRLNPSNSAKLQSIFTINRTASSGKIGAETWAWLDVTTRVSSTNALNDGNWHHAVAVYTLSDNNLRLYIDSVLNDTQSQGVAYLPNILTPYGLTLGFNADFNQHYQGLIDDVRIYNRALSEQEVKDLFGRGIVLRNAVLRNGRFNQ